MTRRRTARAPGSSLAAIRRSMIGRTLELERLAELARRARAGHAGFAVVRGEAGIGKSTLAAQVLAATEGFAVVVARSDELASKEPGGVAAQLVGQLPPPTPGIEPAAAQAELAAAFVDRVQALAGKAPLAMLVEDLHWADGPSMAGLDRLTRAGARLPVLLVTTMRPVPASRDADGFVDRVELIGGQVIDLQPLSPEEIVGITSRTLGAEVGPRLRSQLEMVGGNPLYLAELLAALDNAGALQRTNGAVDCEHRLQAPALPTAIRQHLRTMSEPTVELLSLVSVLGATFTPGDAAVIARQPVGALLSSLREALAAGVLVDEGDQLAFRHHLIRDALYADVPSSVRQQLHCDVAESLAQRGAPGGRVAEHLMRAGDVGEDHVLDLLVRTARGIALTAPATAADLFERFLAVAPRPMRDEVLADYALCRVWAGQFALAEPAAMDAIARGLRPRVSGDLQLAVAVALAGRARIPESLAVCEAALAAGHPDSSIRCRLAAVRAWIRLLQGERDRAVEDAEQVIADPAVEAAPSAASLAFVVLAMCARVRGRYVTAMEFAERAATAADRDRYRDAYGSNPQVVVRTTVLTDLDRHQEALDVLDSDRFVPFETGTAANRSPMRHARALALYHLGRWDDAVTEAATGLQVWGQAGGGHSLTSSAVLTLIATARGDLDSAERHCAAGEAEYEARRSPHNLVLLRMGRARLHAAAGRLPEALAMIHELWTLAVAFDARAEAPLLGVECARLAVLTGTVGSADDVPSELERLAAENPGVPRLPAAARLAEGLVGDDPDVLLAAVEGFRLGTRPVETARAAVDAALSLGRAGRVEEGTTLLDDAVDTLRSVRAAHELAAVEARAREVGLAVSRRRSRRRQRTGWGALTETELTVVRLVAERLTNPEIARRLFLSPRTVQTHVSHALAKLGVSTRGELAAEAGRQAGWHFGLHDEQPGPET